MYIRIERDLFMIEAALSPISIWQNFYVIISIGIRNTWDTVTLIAIDLPRREG